MQLSHRSSTASCLRFRCVSTRWLLHHRSKTRPKKEDIDLLASTRSVHAVRHYYLSFISHLAQRCRLRQRVVATAQVFLRRFYTQSTLAQHDPQLIAITALLVAAKVEECAVNAKTLVKQLQPTAPTGSGGSVAKCCYGVADVLDCEFVLLHALLFDLIVFHPYRPLVHFLASFQQHERYSELVQHSWELVNDSYYCDVALLYPPYVIAIACLYMAAHLLGVDYRAWVRQLATPQQLVADCTHAMLQHLDRREQREKEKAEDAAQAQAEAAVDVMGCVLDRRLSEALGRLREHHDTRRVGRDSAKAADKDEKAGEEAGADGVDAAMVDPSVVILEDERDCVVVYGKDGAVVEDALRSSKKQKVGDG